MPVREKALRRCLADDQFQRAGRVASWVPAVMKGLKPILYAGALCGVLDITAACINSRIASGATSARVLKSVAGGLLGRSAYGGGFATGALGLMLHFTFRVGDRKIRRGAAHRRRLNRVDGSGHKRSYRGKYEFYFHDC